MEIYSHRPYLVRLLAVGLLTIFEIIFYARTVFGQPVLMLADDSGLDPIIKFVSLGSTIILAISFVAGLIWYVLKGKTTEQQAATIKQLETSNADLRATNGELRVEKAELVAEKKELEEENISLRKKNLRLQGGE